MAEHTPGFIFIKNIPDNIAHEDFTEKDKLSLVILDGECSGSRDIS